MLNQTTEHALRAILYLARMPANTRTSAAEVASAIGAPQNYLSKILGNLVRDGIVSSLRGPSGGFKLEASPDDIPISRLIDLLESPSGSATCLLGGAPCSSRTPCSAHARWDAIKCRARSPFEKNTIADLLEGATPSDSAPTDPPGG